MLRCSNYWMCAANLAKQNAEVSPVLANAACDLSSDVLPEIFTDAAFDGYVVCRCMMYVYKLYAYRYKYMYICIHIYMRMCLHMGHVCVYTYIINFCAIRVLCRGNFINLLELSPVGPAGRPAVQALEDRPAGRPCGGQPPGEH